MVESVGRIFLAVDLTSEARQILSRRVMMMTGGCELPGRLTPPRNWHMTLCFLGDIPQDRFEVMGHLLAQAPLGGAFQCRFGSLGSFPRDSRATVLWVGGSEGAASASPAGVKMMVREVTVFRSHLGGGPPRYEVMERIPLN